MKQIMLKFLIVCFSCMNTASAANSIKPANSAENSINVTVEYCFQEGSTMKVEHQLSLMGPNNSLTYSAILPALIDDAGIDEFALVFVCVDDKPVTPDSTITLEKLESHRITIKVDPDNNTPEHLKQRRIEWLADQIDQSVWRRAEIKRFVEENYYDPERNLRSLKTLRDLWSQRKNNRCKNQI